MNTDNRGVEHPVTALLTVQQAAARVERSVRQIERYIEHGLPVAARDQRGRRYVLETDLLKAFRAHLVANPTRRGPSFTHDVIATE